LKLRPSPTVPVAIFAVSVIVAGSLGLHAQVAPADEAAFLTANAAAMDKMMVDMTVRPTGDVDADFAEMMIPHHQGAIDMALAELNHGKNEQLRRIAQEIVVEQQQEIIAMRLALGQPLPPSAPAQPQASPAEPTATPAQDHSTAEHGAMPISPSMTK
jgi:Domain of unknown function (DUF305)